MFRTFLLGSVLFFLFSCGQSGQSNSQAAAQPGIYKLGPKEFMDTYYSIDSAILLDVRTENEYKAGAILPEAINVDYHGKEFLTELVPVLLEKKPVFVYCHSGQRSDKAIFKMKQMGFDHLYDLSGGYALWKKENEQ